MQGVKTVRSVANRRYAFHVVVILADRPICS